jgi:hypothetical protein
VNSIYEPWPTSGLTKKLSATSQRWAVIVRRDYPPILPGFHRLPLF